MAKNPRRAKVLASTVKKPVAPPLFSRRGKKIMIAGGCLVLAGFFTLTFTDPAGQNWASHVAPFLLVVGYSAIGIGIVARDPESSPL